ncbi:MAG: hypothetical protein AB2551_00280 [Candidatus Thiodiazotropha sp.]
MTENPYKSPTSDLTKEAEAQINKSYTSLNIALTISFLIYAVPLVALIAQWISPESLAPSFAIIGGAISYYIVLGVLAVKKGRSAIKWVGLSILTSPFGLIFSYFMMLNAKSVEKL